MFGGVLTNGCEKAIGAKTEQGVSPPLPENDAQLRIRL
ncbi:hypothetical protein FIV00_12865 [Labrenzia sp. THAF82]|nr:hypothetical protein FIV00_12865 [Labrenzia sp. THAF82]